MICRFKVVPLALLVVFTATARDSRAQVPTLDDDRSRLQGEWNSNPKASEKLSILFSKDKDGFDFLSLESPKVEILLVMYELKEKDKKRFIEMNEIVKKLNKISPQVDYRFEKGELILIFGEGKLKGEHRLQKAKDK